MDFLPKRQRFPSSPCRRRVPASKWSNISALRRPLITRVSRHQLTAFSGDPIFLVHLIGGILHLRLKRGASAFLMMRVQLPNLKRCACNSRGWWGYSFERKKLWLRDFAIGVVRCHVILSNPILIEQTPVQLGCNAFRMSSGWKCRKLPSQKWFKKFNYLGFFISCLQSNPLSTLEQIKCVRTCTTYYSRTSI
jgi:hypothetical protein